MRRDLDHVEIPGEHEARERAWRVVLAAYAEREPATPRPTRRLLPALAAVVLVAVVAAAFSSPGRAVLQRLRETVGVEKAQPALFSLPAGGRLLVASDAGVWVAQADGSKRLLGRYDEASWSPHGRFVAAARRNELAALEPGGRVRWTLARPHSGHPRWTGSETDTRIAYTDRTGVRVVAGDGTGDHLVAPHGRGPIAWRPGASFELAYLSGRSLRIENTRTGRATTRTLRTATIRELVWSPDGSRLLAVGSSGVEIVGVKGTSPRAIVRGDIDAAAFAPDGRVIAVLESSQLLLVDTGADSTPRRVFAGSNLHGLAWSPDGRWLLVGSPAADQWVFVNAHNGRLRAVSNVSAQFRTRTQPRIEGWAP